MRFEQETHNPVCSSPDGPAAAAFGVSFVTVDGGSGEVTFPTGLRHRGTGHALALSTLKTPSLTHQCRSIGKLNVLKTGFNKCQNRTAKHPFHPH